MSEHSHDTGADLHDRHFVITPSAGISSVMYVFLALALVIIFWQGNNVISSAAHYRAWPAADSLKVDLPPYKP